MLNNGALCDVRRVNPVCVAHGIAPLRRRTQRRHHQVPHEPRAAVPAHPLHAHVVRADASCTTARSLLKKGFNARLRNDRRRTQRRHHQVPYESRAAVPAHPLHAHVVRAAASWTTARLLLKKDFNTRLRNDNRRAQRRHHQVQHEPRAAIPAHPLHSHVVRFATSCTAARSLLKKDFNTLQSRAVLSQVGTGGRAGYRNGGALLRFCVVGRFRSGGGGP